MIKEITDVASGAVALAGVIVFVWGAILHRRWGAEISFTLDLWAASALLSLTGGVSWGGLAITGAIVGGHSLIGVVRDRMPR